MAEDNAVVRIGWIQINGSCLYYAPVQFEGKVLQILL
jgi:hypothetical protein